MDWFLARVCWNRRGWSQPSGDARSLETNTFVARHGFGFDEWLFSDRFEFEGWHYGFVQGVQRRHSTFVSQDIALRFFSIGPTGDRWSTGSISRCTVLEHDQAHLAVSQFQATHLIELMVDQVRAVNGDSAFILDRIENDVPLDVINIRFRLDRGFRNNRRLCPETRA